MSALTDRMKSDVAGVFLRASDFADEARFTFGNVEKTIFVLFDENYIGHDAYGNEVANTGPVAMCVMEDALDADGKAPGEHETNRATLTINDTLYNVTKCAREGDVGMLTLSKDF